MGNGDGKMVSLLQHIGGKISRDTMFKVFDRNATLIPLIGPLNFKFGEGLIIWYVLNVTALCRLRYKMSQITACAEHSQLDLVIVGM